MTARKEPRVFLKALLLHLDTAERRQLLDSLATAERKEKSVHRAVFLTMLFSTAALAGLGYCAVLLPEAFLSPSHLLVRSLLVLALGSLISQAVFLGYLFWYRTVVARLHAECRQRVLALARSQHQVPATASPAIPV